MALFILRFLIPAWLLKRDLKKAIKRIQALTDNTKVVDVERIGKEAMTSKKLSHLWSEFAETLHPQTAPDEMGQERVIRWRSTVSAEAYFNVETLIAVELRTEYFKHQPGILTGIGIIGTFAGLLRGLTAFSVSSDPETVRASLDTLIHGVLEAFYVSASAISLAMITTFVEKITVTRRIKQVEELCHLLDSLFEGGAGEEYLSRLVKASESSATQTAQLKDSLVSDLKEILAEMTRHQTEAIAASFHDITQRHVVAITDSSKAQVQTTEQSGDRIAQAITECLSDPIQKIAAAVQSTNVNNGDVVTRALSEALVAFSQKLEDMFGGQMVNMNQLLLQTTASMQSTVARFDQLANNLSDAGKNAADAMSERLATALESMEARQHALNSTMTEFVSQLRDMVKTSQSATDAQLQQTLAQIGDKVVAMTEQIERQARLAAETHQNQQTSLAQNASNLTGELGAQIQATSSAMQQQLNAMLDVLREQSAQTVSTNAEQQRNLTQHTQNTVESLSGRVESAITAVDDQMKGTMSAIQQQLVAMVDSLKESSTRTNAANEQQQKQFVQNSQHALDAIANKFENTVANIDQKMSGFVDLLAKQTDQASSSHLANQQRLSEQANRLIEQLSQQVQALLAQNGTAVSSMQASVSALREVTSDATRRLEGSADTLSLAADNFAKAGNSVNGVMQQANALGDKMTATSVSLNHAASAVETALEDYDNAGKAMTQMVVELKNIVSVAKQDASVSQSLVDQIKKSAEHLLQAQSQVDGIFKQVCDALGDAHEAFAKNVENTLKKSNTAYQKELKDAVDYLKSAIEELGEVAEKIPTRR